MRVSVDVAVPIGNHKRTIPVVRRRYGYHPSAKARAVVGSDKMINGFCLGVHEMGVVGIARQQGGSSAGERNKHGQPAVIKIAGGPPALHQLAKRKAESGGGRPHQQIAVSRKNSRQPRGARSQRLIGHNPGAFEQMREVKGPVKMIPVPMRENDRRFLASLDIEIGRKGVAIERDRKSDIEMQDGAAAAVA